MVQFNVNEFVAVQLEGAAEGPTGAAGAVRSILTLRTVAELYGPQRPPKSRVRTCQYHLPSASEEPTVHDVEPLTVSPESQFTDPNAESSSTCTL
jgi:hypothetical protein